MAWALGRRARPRVRRTARGRRKLDDGRHVCRSSQTPSGCAGRFRSARAPPRSTPSRAARCWCAGRASGVTAALSASDHFLYLVTALSSLIFGGSTGPSSTPARSCSAGRRPPTRRSSRASGARRRRGASSLWARSGSGTSLGGGGGAQVVRQRALRLADAAAGRRRRPDTSGECERAALAPSPTRAATRPPPTRALLGAEAARGARRRPRHRGSAARRRPRRRAR